MDNRKLKPVSNRNAPKNDPPENDSNDKGLTTAMLNIVRDRYEYDGNDNDVDNDWNTNPQDPNTSNALTVAQTNEQREKAARMKSAEAQNAVKEAQQKLRQKKQQEKEQEQEKEKKQQSPSTSPPPVPPPPSNALKAMAKIFERRKFWGSDSDAESESDTDAFAPGTVAIGTQMAKGRGAEDLVNAVTARIKAEKGYIPVRDSIVLAMRVTERLYQAVRDAGFCRASESDRLGIENVDNVTQAMVRSFCGHPNITAKSALDLVSLFLTRR